MKNTTQLGAERVNFPFLFFSFLFTTHSPFILFMLYAQVFCVLLHKVVLIEINYLNLFKSERKNLDLNQNGTVSVRTNLFPSYSL